MFPHYFESAGAYAPYAQRLHTPLLCILEEKKTLALKISNTQIWIIIRFGIANSINTNYRRKIPPTTHVCY